MNRVQCPSRQELSAFAEGYAGDERSLDQIAEHLESCDICLEALKTENNASSALLAVLRNDQDLLRHDQEPQCKLALGNVLSNLECMSKSASYSQSNLESMAGKTIGQYALEVELGSGGMGVVYRAMHTKLKRPVAVKVLHADRMQTMESVRRFEQEMAAVGALSHVNVVSASDAGESEGVHFLVMELLDGLDLSTVARRVGPLAVADACEVIRQVALGLQYAHANLLIHRDVKPSNIMLVRGDSSQGSEPSDPIVKLLDLGLARPQGIESGESVTSAGQMMGTIDYVSPEQCADSKLAGPHSDIYSLGAALYRLLGGQVPWHGSNYPTAHAKLKALMSGNPPSIATLREDLPPGLIALIDSMLDQEPTRRPQSATDVANALAAYVDGHDLKSLLQRGEAWVVPEETNDTHESLVTQQLTPRHVSPKVSSGSRIWILSLLIPIAVLAGIMVYLSSGDGKARIKLTISDPKIELQIADGTYTIKDSGETIRLTPGEHEVHVTRGDLEFDTVKFTVGTRNRTDFIVESLLEETRLAIGDKTFSLAPAEPTATFSETPALGSPIRPEDADRKAIEAILAADGRVYFSDDQERRYTLDSKQIVSVPAGDLKLNIAELNSIDEKQFVSICNLLQDCEGFYRIRLNASCLLPGDSLGRLADIASLSDITIGIPNLRTEHLSFLEQMPWVKEFSLENRSYDNSLLVAVVPHRQIRTLHFYGSFTDDSVFPLREMPNLKHVYLQSDHLTDKCWQLAADMDQIIRFNLVCPQVTGEGMELLSECESLESVNLSRSGVTNEALRHVRKIPQLQELNLWATGISDAGLEHLHGTQLTKINLSETRVTAEGVAKLMQKLPGCEIDSDFSQEDLKHAEASLSL